MKLLPILVSVLLAAPLLQAEDKPVAEADPTEESSEPAAPAKKKGKALFNGKDLTGWEALEFGGSGEVLVKENGILSIGEGNMLSGAKLTKLDAIPVGKPYEIHLEARKVAGVDFFCGLTFPVDDVDTCATLILGGWGGGLIGISSIDGLDASENSSTEFMRFEKNQWYKIRLRVTPKNRLQAWIDDKRVIDSDISHSKVGMRPGDIEMTMPFGLSTFQTEGEFRKLRVVPAEK